MIRKTLFLFFSLMLGIGNSWAEGFDEGIEYSRIKNPVTTSHPDKVVVSEMFWYGCPHCYRFEPYIEKWKKTMPEGVVLEQVPSVLNPSWMEHARAYFALQIMGDLDKVHMKLMKAIHLQNQRLNNLEALARFVADLGVDEAKFREHFHSFPVDTMIRKSRSKEKKYGHRGVPAVVVNGKYLTSGSMAGSNSRMIEVIDYLVKKELQEK